MAVMRSGAMSPRRGFFKDFFGVDFVVGMDGELWLVFVQRGPSA
jgi:hypothetical protein